MEAARAFDAWMSQQIDIATVVLGILLIGSLWVIWKAQQRQDFDFAEMLRDDSGKPSVLRMAVMGSFAVSSWVVMHDTLANDLTDQQFWAYLATWSGAAIMRVFAECWNGQLPWSKP